MRRVIVSLMIAFVTLAAVAPAASADDRPPREMYGGGFGYFLGGMQRLYLGSLRHALSDAGYPSMSDTFITFGGGGYAIIKERFVVGGEGAALVGDEQPRGPYRVSIGGGYGFFDLGYIVLKAGELRLYPFIGIGGGGLSVDIIDSRTASFGDVLRNPARSTSLSTGTFLMQGALGLDYLLNFSNDPFRSGGIMVGLRIGYVINPMYRDLGWDADDAPVGYGPHDVFHGPYIRLAIGGGGYGPAHDHCDGCRCDGDRDYVRTERTYKAKKVEKKETGDAKDGEKKDEAKQPERKDAETKPAGKIEEPKPAEKK